MIKSRRQRPEIVTGWATATPAVGPRFGWSRVANRYTAVGLAAVGVAVAAWSWAATRTLPLFLPSPADVWTGTVQIAQEGLLQADVLSSYERVLIGWALGGLVGIPLGLLAGRARLVSAAVAPFVNFFRFVPPIALISLAIIWFGIGEYSKIMLIFYASMFLVFLNTTAGSTSVNVEKLRAAESMGASRVRTFLFVILPATLPSIAVGLRVAMSNSFSAVVAAELVAAQTGIGFLIFSSRLLGRTDLVFVGILFLGAMGFVADVAFRRIVGLVAYRYEIHL